jgi:hypothetical protein
MGLKRSIVLVGSVLVLAACDRVSAPTGPLSLHEGGAASVKKSGGAIPLMSETQMSDCPEGQGGFVKSGGSDSTFVCFAQ